MGRLTLVGAVIAVGLALAAPAGGALEVRVTVSPKRVHALERTTVAFRTYTPLLREDGSCCRLEPWAARSYPFRVEAVSPSGKVSRIGVRWLRGNQWRGVIRFPRPGRWQVRLPQVFRTIDVRVRPALATPAPAGFGPLGRAGCAPPSPARDGEVFGTAVGDEQLWAMPVVSEGAAWGRDDAAVFDRLVGKEMKIVFAMTSHRTPFHAVGPDGTVVEPVWVRGHLGANFARIPGPGWGAGFVFSRPGCWQIKAGSIGSVWLSVRS